MAHTVFEYEDYKAYLKDALLMRGDQKRGERSRLAGHIGCHTAYVSQVLNAGAHFSLEQAERINRFLGHSQQEGLYFLTLVQFNRAGSPGLKAVFEEQLRVCREKQFVLKERLAVASQLSREDQVVFYSSWHYGAIHVLVSVPGCHTERGISEYLGLSQERVNEVLRFLVDVGLVVRRKGGYVIGTTHVHLEQDAPMISKHHTNWRLQALNSLEQPSPRDLHYSSVITASLADSDRIRAILVDAIEKVRRTVKSSRDEAAFAYTIDFFRVGKP